MGQFRVDFAHQLICRFLAFITIDTLKDTCACMLRCVGQLAHLAATRGLGEPPGIDNAQRTFLYDAIHILDAPFKALLLFE
jgi:hypothetical protein